jgi:CheY-like chemotaxis protein
MDSKTLTQGGMIVGTPYYMSPEQALGKAVDSRSDIFSLGTVMYEAIAGRRPFDGESVTETMMNIIMNEPPDLGALMPSAPVALADVVRRALQKKPERRFGSAGEMMDAMNSINFDAPHLPLAAKKYDPTVALPASTAQQLATPPPQPPPAQPSFVPIPGQRALVADDDPVARYLIGSLLTQHRIAFDECGNGADAVKALKTKEYTLLFVDLLMPRVDGWGVIDYIRRAKSAKMPRIFVITGVKDQNLSTADRDIVAGLLYKPLDPTDIDRAIQKTLSGAHA